MDTQPTSASPSTWKRDAAYIATPILACALGAGWILVIQRMLSLLLSPEGGGGLVGAMMWTTPALVVGVFLFMIVGQALIASKKWRVLGVHFTLCSLSFVLGFFITLCFTNGRHIEERFTKFEQVGLRLTPLIDAVEEFHAKTGKYPETLDHLVPEYIDAVPTTGMREYRDILYLTGSDARRYEGNPWVVVIDASWGYHTDQLLYFPRGNYPQTGYGGYFQQLGDWAYVVK